MSRNILIVDDIASNRSILKRILRNEYGIIEAVNGRDALDILAEKHEQISAVLLDIKMPEMDGFETLSRIRASELFSSMPVIMITGSDDDEARIRSLALGANDFVMKPYTPDVIKHCLRNTIAFHDASAAVYAMQRDKLTGLLSREPFFEKVHELVSAHEPSHYIMASFDIDKFKIINDQYGMHKGDEVLIHTADVFREGFEQLGGVCCRVSADNFAVLYPAALKDSPEVAAVRDRASHIDGLISPILFSIGRFIVDDVTLPPAVMYDRAVIASVSVKGRYDEKIAYYDEAMRARLIQEQSIVLEMENALQTGQFEVWFQPQYNHASGAMIGAEALVRWRHPQKGLIPPNKFIHIFEQNGFIYTLDKFVWETACRCLRMWIDADRSPLPVSVNISRYDVLRPDIVEVLDELVKKYSLPIELLRLEITESAFSESSQLIVDVVKELLDKGFTVEIDDFGSGYSSLNTLKDVPAQIIKLDMKFLESGDDSQRGGNIVESIVRMAKWLGMSVIAEGVEMLEQADYLRSIGCCYIQGYLYAKPMPMNEYEEYCSKSSKEEHLLTLETVENLNNNSFWDPKSMDTLIFNSYVGGACIYEFHHGRIELLRATEKYAQVIGSAGMTVEDALKLDWSKHLDEDTNRRVVSDLQESVATRSEVTGEYVFLDLPNCPHETHLRSTMRVIASAGERYLVYCTNENVTAQRQAEHRARVAAEQIQSMMDDMPGGFARLSIAPDGSVSPVYVNDEFLKLMKLTREEFSTTYKNGNLPHIHPDDTSIIQEAHDAVVGMLASGETHKARYRLMRSDGSYIWLSVFGRVTVDASGDAFLNVYYTDASEQVKEEEAQKSLLDNIPSGAGLYEFSGGQMSLIYQNKSFWELVGLSEEVYPDSSVMSAIHPDDKQIIMQELSSAIIQNRDVVCDVRLRHLTKGYRPVRLVGHIVFDKTGKYLIYATFTPTDQTGMTFQQTLPLLLSAIMEASNDYAFAKDRDYRYICCSPAFVRLAGLKSEQEVIGRTDYDLFPADMAKQFRDNDIMLFESDSPLVDFSEVIHSTDGTPHYCLTSKYILRDATGERIGIYGISHDVTKEHSALEQLQLVNDSIPGGIATYSVQNGSVRLLYCNDGFCKLFGGTRRGMEKLGDIDPIEWVFEEDRAELMAQVNALAMHGTQIDCIYRVHVIGGGYKWINEKAALSERRNDTTFFNAILLDVTERRNSSELLRIKEEESSLSARLGGTITARFSVADRTISLDPDTARLHELPAVVEDMPYGIIRLGLVAPDSTKVYISFIESIISGNKAASTTIQLKYHDEWRWFEMKGSTIFNDDGEAVKAIISYIDITDRIERDTVYKKWQQSLQDRQPESYTLYRCNISKYSSFDITEGSLITFEIEDGSSDFDDRTAKYVAQCVFEDDRDRFFAFLNADSLLANFYQGSRVLLIEYREKLDDGSVRWLRLTVDLVDSLYTSDVDAYMLFEDIDAAKKREMQLMELSETDPLTGTLNQDAFAEKISRLLSASKPYSRHALLKLDIDGIRQINDLFGHDEGNQVLIDIAGDLHSMMRRNDFAARLGSSEFIVFLHDILDNQSAATKAKQICCLIRKSFSPEGQISASAGISLFPHDGTDYDTLYKKADAALYYAKDSDKNDYMFYSGNMANEQLAPAPDTAASNTAVSDSGIKAAKKRRILVVTKNVEDRLLINDVFHNDFIIETAKDAATALVRLRHYGSAISAVLLDLLPGMNSQASLEKMRESVELRAIPIIAVGSDDSYKACFSAMQNGAMDFIIKPISADLLRIRVYSAIRKAENERILAKNSLHEIMNEERMRYESALDGIGITFVELDWRTGEFTYYSSIGRYLLGTYDSREFWRILLSDRVADTQTVQDMQQLVHSVAENKASDVVMTKVRLRTPRQEIHNFRVTVRRITNEFQSTSKVIITLVDMDFDLNAHI